MTMISTPARRSEATRRRSSSSFAAGSSSPSSSSSSSRRADMIPMFATPPPSAGTSRSVANNKAIAVLFLVALTALAALSTSGSGTSAVAAAAASGGPVLRLHEAPPPKQPKQPSLRRRLNDQREDCPTNSLYHCDNPSLIMSDPDVVCDMDTCEWDTSALQADREPTLCRSIVITNVSALDDYLEPCLWWEMLYGDLATSSPGILNGTTLAPIPPPDSEAEQDGGTDADEGNGDAAEVETTDWIEFETILLTFLVDTQSLGSTKNKSSSSSSSTSTSSNDNRKGRRRGLRRKLLPKTAASAGVARRNLEQTMDAEALLELTTSHVMSEIKKKLGDDVADVSLVITPVSTSSTRSTETQQGQLASLSQAVNGKVKFNQRVEDQVDSPGVVQHMVDQAFEGDAMERFLNALKGSDDPVMQHIEIVYKGLPSDLQGTSDTGSTNDSDESLASSFEWNNWWIFIVVGAGAGLLVCCLSSSCVFYRCWTAPPRDKKSKQKKVDDDDGGVDPTQSNDGTAPVDESESPRAKIGSSGSKSPVAGLTESKADQMDVAEDVAAAGAGAEDATNSKFGGGDDSLLDVSEMDNESYVGRYNPSDATSVYSYIDGHTMMLADGDDVDVDDMEDQSSYSIAPSLMYDRIMPDDQSIQSRMWSVADGITYDGNVSLIDGKAAPGEVAPGRVLVFGGGNKSGKGSGKGAGGAGLNVDDDDDDLSLMSELNAPEGNVQKGNSELRVLQVVKKPDLAPVEAAATAKDPHPTEVSKPPPASHPTPYTNMKSDDDDDSSSVSSYGPSASDEVTALKKRLGSQGVSVRVRKSKENLMNNRDVIAALGESSASDDDSSLFMGPADLGKGSSSLLPLSAKDKVDPLATSTNGSGKTKKRDELRFGPLRLGNKKLSKKEKEHLKLGVKEADQQSDDAGMRAFPIPRDLMNQSEEKKDDMSVSSIGSSEANRAKALIDSVASF